MNEQVSKLSDEGYKPEGYIHYRKIDTGSTRSQVVKRKGKEDKVNEVLQVKKVLEDRKIPFNVVDELNLDVTGSLVPSNGKDFTLTHNYFLDYWGAIMGHSAVMAFIHLERYAYGHKRHCFPEIDQICLKMQTSRPTLNKYMDILEANSFIARIYRKNEDTKKDASPLFIIRRYIPFLSAEQVNQLPKKLREEHDKFVSNLKGIMLSDNSELKSQAEIKKALSTSERFGSKEKKEPTTEQIRRYQAIKLGTMETEDVECHVNLQQALRERVSKPSYDTWLGHAVFTFNRQTKELIASFPMNFQREWVQGHYDDIIKECVADTLGEVTISYKTHENEIEAGV
ncbi:hypothetical protein HB667_26960 [Bacillus cereus]|uniref:DnaA N-terminal domain-containing protein n=1 Tax=Bacillus cereus group TaxID=86661 RepID=UPI001444897A|nr:DnaA N-terminal domain-containing protein [Bacillus cereus]NKW77456.1 hypothetical protein [Bacillus cereus]NKX14874.1 hypothetical protein [Bacillus cereus]